MRQNDLPAVALLILTAAIIVLIALMVLNPGPSTCYSTRILKYGIAVCIGQ